jgi:hypothetical protein
MERPIPTAATNTSLPSASWVPAMKESPFGSPARSARYVAAPSKFGREPTLLPSP